MYCILLTLMFAILDNYVEFEFISLLVKGPCVARFYVKIYRIYNYYTKLVIIKKE